MIQQYLLIMNVPVNCDGGRSPVDSAEMTGDQGHPEEERSRR